MLQVPEKIFWNGWDKHSISMFLEIVSPSWDVLETF